MDEATNLKAMRKSSRDKWIGGVCGGLGAFTPVPSWLWRVIFLGTFLAVGFGLLAYILLWIFMPAETSTR